MHGRNNEDVSGDYIYQSKNVRESFVVEKGDDCKEIFQTSYAPERPEIVYCEECYLKNVY